jgi:hypothetical protein
MANEAQAIKQLIRVKLIQDSGVTGLVEGRIYGAHFQDPDAQTPTYPLVILEWIGSGHLQYSMAFQKMRMDIWCYDKVSASNALNLYGKVVDALQQESLVVDGIPQRGYMNEAVRPIEGFNEKVRAYFVRGEFFVIATGATTP